ncbi:hypothetical protein IAD21_03501 [Abditibacteriota bacterium]|nr:hypothetical protein IAD21_03501 [Abditibacteriota bacterium]
MTNFLLPALLGLVALAYIFMPLLAGASERNIHAVNYVPGVEELDLDHDLGKIDDEEWTTRRAQMETAARELRPQLTDIERLIWNFRRSQRADLALEAEILIARGRKKRS